MSQFLVSFLLTFPTFVWAADHAAEHLAQVHCFVERRADYCDLLLRMRYDAASRDRIARFGCFDLRSKTACLLEADRLAKEPARAKPWVDQACSNGDAGACTRGLEASAGLEPEALRNELASKRAAYASICGKPDSVDCEAFRRKVEAISVTVDPNARDCALRVVSLPLRGVREASNEPLGRATSIGSCTDLCLKKMNTLGEKRAIANCRYDGKLVGRTRTLGFAPVNGCSDATFVSERGLLHEPCFCEGRAFENANDELAAQDLYAYAVAQSPRRFGVKTWARCAAAVAESPGRAQDPIECRKLRASLPQRLKSTLNPREFSVLVTDVKCGGGKK